MRIVEMITRFVTVFLMIFSLKLSAMDAKTNPLINEKMDQIVNSLENQYQAGKHFSEKYAKEGNQEYAEGIKRISQLSFELDIAEGLYLLRESFKLDMKTLSEMFGEKISKKSPDFVDYTANVLLKIKKNGLSQEAIEARKKGQEYAKQLNIDPIIK